jgi:hypothetical protein
MRATQELDSDIGEVREVDGQKVATLKNTYEIYERQKVRVDGWLRSFAKDFAAPIANAKGGVQFREEVTKNFSDWGAAWSPQMWDYIHPLFVELKRLSLEHNFQLLVLCFPVRPQVEADGVFDYPQRQLQRITGELEISMLDILPVLRAARSAQSGELFYDYCHHTPEGNRVMAEAVYEFIRSAQ